ncbi:MAG TPA: VanZ family protein [Candidatus Corynebacterium gallistercoris]|uniref:VanZ family protein n=1 Tax=Candidatus Corynebacterium gallistercoris TaxID=2838530 RepID=A0A9D1RW17_9CORY|nr:VanZ family protein [Candidatus Corynebacterium gallistercoris]
MTNHGTSRDNSPPLIWLALAVYTAVMVSLVMLKSFYRIGYLWDPANQRRRGVSLQPLAELGGGTWFGPLFSYGGNVAFFVPFGVLVYVLLWNQRRWGERVRGERSRLIVVNTLIGMATSVAMEAAQYVFALGHTDIDDLLFNTLGAAVGAGFAALCGPRWHKVWVWLALAVGVVFAVLVGLGERLGDPDKVVDV